jgi:hypothetical protein
MKKLIYTAVTIAALMFTTLSNAQVFENKQAIIEPLYVSKINGQTFISFKNMKYPSLTEFEGFLLSDIELEQFINYLTTICESDNKDLISMTKQTIISNSTASIILGNHTLSFYCFIDKKDCGRIIEMLKEQRKASK